MAKETIFAWSSGEARAGVAVFRVSGVKVTQILNEFCGNEPFLPRQLSVRTIRNPDSGEIIDADRKAGLLKEIARSEGIALQQTIAIGDGANDLPMLSSAGLGVAFHAKPVVRESAQHAISNFGLDTVLYLIGFSDRDISQALSATN